jgi:Alpha/beta hydrolase
MPMATGSPTAPVSCKTRLRYISVPLLIAEAGGDPWAVNASLQTGRPAQISALANAFHEAGQSTAEASAAFDEARRRFEASWNHENGDHSFNDSAEVQRVTAQLGLQAAQLPNIAVDLEVVAAVLAEAQRVSTRHICALDDDLEDIDDEIGEALGEGDDDEADELCGDAVAETAAILFQLNEIRSGYSSTLRTAQANLRLGVVDPSRPERVVDWWRSLSVEQQRLLVDQHPRELGNLDGIPADVRDAVNRAVLSDDVRRVEDATFDSGALSATEVTRYQNAVKTNEGLEQDRGTDPDHPRPVLLWAYDPMAFAGKGRTAIAIGDPDKCANTAVVVPGTNSSVAEGWLADGHDDAINLYDQSLKAVPGQSTAVVAWMGYDAPEFDYHQWERALIDPARLQEIGTPWMARQGAALLASDVNGLSATHRGSSHVTVLGHSYGSTTVADAFANYGMRANDAVLIGCPGTDLARSAGDFHLNDGKVYVGAASTDAVTWIGESGDDLPRALNVAVGGPLGALVGLGADPAHDGFGAVRFRAEVAGSNSVVPWFSDHSHYYDTGSEALHNMTEIVIGRGDNLAGEGMTAPDRVDARISLPSEVHSPFGTLQLPHVEIRAPVPVDPEWDRPGDSVTNDHGFS